jgi:glucose 1-dehydrogenase
VGAGWSGEGGLRWRSGVERAGSGAGGGSGEGGLWAVGGPEPGVGGRRQAGAGLVLGDVGIFVAVKAMSVIPGQPDSAQIADVPEPPLTDGSILVEGLLAGICGTDREVLLGGGQPPPGTRRLVIGHESLGRVLDAPADAGFRVGDLVAGVVRRPDPMPCRACAAGQWDFCENGNYTERGIKEMDGYGAARWRVDPRFAIAVPARLGNAGVLTEPASVLAKAWEQIDKITARAPRSGCTALVAGAGPIGLLAALLGVQRGFDVHVLDRVTGGPKPRLVAALGATYHHCAIEDLDLTPDVVVECAGVGELVIELADRVASAAAICLVGISSAQRSLPVNLDKINAALVLKNAVLLGTVSAARRNYEQAVDALLKADPEWLAGLISRSVPLSTWPDALDRQPGDVKVTVDLTR